MSGGLEHPVDLDAVQDRSVASQGSFDAWCDVQTTSWDRVVRVLDGEDR